MKLSVLERLTLQSLLPEKGSFTNLKLIRVAREALSFTDKEHKLLQFRVEMVGDQQKSHWNANQLVNKTTGKLVEGDQKLIEKLILANPDNFEMRPTVDEVEINLGEVVTHMIAKILRDMDTADPPTLENRHFSLYEKFVDNATPTPTLNVVK